MVIEDREIILKGSNWGWFEEKEVQYLRMSAISHKVKVVDPSWRRIDTVIEDAFYLLMYLYKRFPRIAEALPTYYGPAFRCAIYNNFSMNKKGS